MQVLYALEAGIVVQSLMPDSAPSGPPMIKQVGAILTVWKKERKKEKMHDP